MEISTRVNHDGTLSKVYRVGTGYSNLTITRNYSGELTGLAKDEDNTAYYVKMSNELAGITLSENQMLEFFSAFLAVKQEYEEINNGTD